MRKGMPYVKPGSDKVSDEDFMQAEALTIEVGGRCEVSPGAKRGVVR